MEEITTRYHEISNWPLFLKTDPLNHIPRERHICSFFNMHLGSGALCMHVTYVPLTCLLSEQIENTSLTFPVWLHDAVKQTVLRRKFIPQLAESLKSCWSNIKTGTVLGFILNQIRGVLEESACCLQETVLFMAVWREGGGPGRTINRGEFKLKVVRGGGMGVHVQNKKGIQDKETFTRTKCTSAVIYKFSSPSSFQLDENKSQGV